MQKIHIKQVRGSAEAVVGVAAILWLQVFESVKVGGLLPCSDPENC